MLLNQRYFQTEDNAIYCNLLLFKLFFKSSIILWLWRRESYYM